MKTTLAITSVKILDSLVDLNYDKYILLDVKLNLISSSDFSDYVSKSGVLDIDKIMVDIMNGKIQIKGMAT